MFYKDALAIEFTERGLPFRSEVPCPVEYKGRPLRGEYRIDFVCYDQIVLKIKARSMTGPADHAQVINYLASSKLRCGLLLNFGTPKLEHKRFIWEPRVSELSVPSAALVYLMSELSVPSVALASDV